MAAFNPETQEFETGPNCAGGSEIVPRDVRRRGPDSLLHRAQVQGATGRHRGLAGPFGGQVRGEFAGDGDQFLVAELPRPPFGELERRTSPRRSLAVPIRVRPEGVPWFEETMTLDFSRQSLRFLSNREYQPCEYLVVSFEAPATSPWPSASDVRPSLGEAINIAASWRAESCDQVEFRGPHTKSTNGTTEGIPVSLAFVVTVVFVV